MIFLRVQQGRRKDAMAPVLDDAPVQCHYFVHAFPPGPLH